MIVIEKCLDKYQVMEVEIKDRILKVFNRKRERPDSSFEELYFLEYLTFPPKDKGKIKNSFIGVRRFYRFMDNLELEFGICFTLSDLDNPNYSIDELTEKVKERIGKRKGNLIIIKQRISDKENYYLEFLLLLILTVVFVNFKIHWISVILTVLIGVFFYWVTWSKMLNKKHDKRLYRIITDRKAN